MVVPFFLAAIRSFCFRHLIILVCFKFQLLSDPDGTYSVYLCCHVSKKLANNIDDDDDEEEELIVRKPKRKLKKSTKPPAARELETP